MELKEQFEAASEKVNTLTKRPTNGELLNLYGLYKQGTEGDVNGPKPGMFDIKGNAKYKAWEVLKGKGKEEAQQEYVSLVDALIAKYR